MPLLARPAWPRAAPLAVTFFGVVLCPPLFGALFGWLGTYRAGFLALAVITGLAWSCWRGATACCRLRTLHESFAGQ